LAQGDGNVLRGNFVGVDPGGAFALSNPNYGVFIDGANNTLGGGTPAARNVISGAAFGVQILGDGNVVSGNYIGLRADNTGTIFNVFGLRDDAVDTRIGGTTPGERNVISGNQDHGLILAGSDATVEGNYIGTDATGMSAFPNGLFGIADGGVRTIIGGLT